jgi:Cadherin-like
MFSSLARHFVRPSPRAQSRPRPARSATLTLEPLDNRITPSLDQVFDPLASGSNNYFATSCAYFNTSQEEAQTFTCGLTGTLAEVDLYISRFDSNDVGDLIVDIRACQADGRPTSAGDPLASVTVPATSVPGNPVAFFPVNFTGANLSVTSGEQLAVLIHVANDPEANVTYYWEGRTGNLYGGGGFTDRVIGNYDWQAVSTDGDLGFKTFVDAGASQPPVVTLPGGPVSYVAGQPPVVLSRSATVTDPDSPSFNRGTLTVSLTAGGTVDDRLAIQDQGTGSGQIGVAGTTVTYSGTAIGTFAGGVGLTPLAVTLNANATPTSTQALVENLIFNDVAVNPVTGSRTVQVVLTDGGGGTSTPAATTVNVFAADQPPTVTTNTGLTVTEGGFGVITRSDLETTDPDNSPDQLTYAVSAGPAHGTLLVNGTAAMTFTQADVNAGNVSYLNNGSVNTSDSFTFTVSDGQLSTASTTFDIVVTTVNNPPTLMTNAELIVVKGSSAVIGHAALDTADPDNTSSQLVYTISTAPAHGTLELGGQSVATFTQADLDAGRVSYVNGGSAATTDSFTFTVSDGTASTPAATFAITVDTVPQVTLAPVSAAAFAGTQVTLTAGASGTPVPTARWQVKTSGGSFVDIPGANSPTYKFVPTVANDGDQYQAVFTNPVGDTTTAAATLSVKPGLIVLTEPSSQTVPLGQTAVFTARATGSTKVAVQWQVSTDGGATYANIPGATKPALRVTKVSAAQDAAQYRTVFTNSAGQAATPPATLTVSDTVILASKQAIVVRPGTAVTLAAQAKTAPTAVQWQVSTDLGHTWTIIAGASGVTYTFTATAGDSGHLVRAQVTIGGKTSFSPPATLTVMDPPAIMSSPADQAEAIGQSILFSAAAAGTGVKVQWQVSTDGGTTFTNVRGAIKSALVLKKLTTAMNGRVYRAVFTNAVGATESATATLTVT